MDDTRCQDSHNNKDQVIVMDCLQISALLGLIALLRKATISFSMTMSVCPHGTTSVPLDVFSWKFIFWDFDWNLSFRAKPGSKLRTIWGILSEDLCTYLVKYFVGGKGKSQRKVVVNVTIRISFYVIYPEIRAVYETVMKNAAESYRPYVIDHKETQSRLDLHVRCFWRKYMKRCCLIIVVSDR